MEKIRITLSYDELTAINQALYNENREENRRLRGKIISARLKLEPKKSIHYEFTEEDMQELNKPTTK